MGNESYSRGGGVGFLLEVFAGTIEQDYRNEQERCHHHATGEKLAAEKGPPDAAGNAVVVAGDRDVHQLPSGRVSMHFVAQAISPALGPPTDWGELVQMHDDRAVFQATDRRAARD